MPSPLDSPFLPASGTPLPLPIDRFLPPVGPGMVSKWIEKNIAPGSWVIDPFGSNPALALEASRAGIRILVTSNNPVLSFILEVLSSAPSQSDFQAILAEIGSLRRGDERLEPHLKSLYRTECPACGQTIPAQAFLWKKEENQPFGRLINCPICGCEGEFSVSLRDLERLSISGQSPLHRARAMERLGLEDNDALESAQEALNTYQSRSLYFLFTLINRSEGLTMTPQRRRLLQAMILSACDQGNTLWTWPSARSRPRQLITPPQFRENNLWLVMEEAWKDWVQPGPPVILTHWPELPPSGGGICLYRGRLKNLLPIGLNLSAALAVVPRPNQAFWTLSTLWSAWIWGREAAQQLLYTLERRRYDWSWHTSALQSTFAPLAQHSASDLRLFALLPDLAPGFLSAAMIATAKSGFRLENFSLRESDDIAQAVWINTAPIARTRNNPPQKIIRQVILNQLSFRKQPTPYILLHAASLVDLSTSNNLIQSSLAPGADLLNHTQSAIREVFNDHNFLERYESQAQTIESGLWWLTQPPPDMAISLTDQIEMEIVTLLGKGNIATLEEIEGRLCEKYPGLCVPSTELILACLESYAETIQGETKKWKLADKETPTYRRADINEALQNLKNLARSLGLSTQGENPITWHDSSHPEEPKFWFSVIASSVISRMIFNPPSVRPPNCVIVLPGGRSRWMIYKLRNDPFLKKAAADWRFLKFRQLRLIANQADIDLTQFEEMLTFDQPNWDEDRQISMFD